MRLSSSGRGLAPPASPYPQHVDPSPTDSNGTESTEIDEDSQEDTEEETPEPTPSSKPTSPSSGLDNVGYLLPKRTMCICVYIYIYIRVANSLLTEDVD